MKRKPKYRSQSRIPGITRTPVFSSLLPEIEESIRSDMHMFKVSRSFVIATHLAHAYGIATEDYSKPRLLKKRA